MLIVQNKIQNKFLREEISQSSVFTQNMEEKPAVFVKIIALLFKELDKHSL